MPLQDELGARMKEFYEEIPKTKLMRRTPGCHQSGWEVIPYIHTWNAEAF